jgi:hypothetical protein
VVVMELIGVELPRNKSPPGEGKRWIGIAVAF